MKHILSLFVFCFFLISLNAQIQYVPRLSVTGTVTDITHAGDGSNRIFVASKSGIISIFDQNYNPQGTLLNISTLIATDGEKGLLGLAFHPSFASNGHFFVNYNPTGTNHTVIARFTATVPSANTTVLNSSLKTIITITDAAGTNHKAGDLAFGPDGYLYIPTGDGGGSGDPQGSGQNGNTFLGKILRLDINTTLAYVVPATNPFIGNANVLDEIWDLGLRNPWRISFDRQTHDLWIGDVGQGAREEIDFEASGSAGGYNYGWNCREGFIAYNGCANSASYTAPIFDYSRCSSPCTTPGFGNSVTGGFVYRGTKPANASMVGYYIFADYVHKHAWMIKNTGGTITDTKTIASLTTSGITTFGELENGELMAGRGDGNIGTIESTLCGQGLAPTISISSSASSYIRNTSFTVNATTADQDGTPVRVEFYNGNTLLGTDLTAPFSFLVSPANAASYNITGRVYDDCGLMTTSSALVITTTVSCSDGVQNGTETGVDCGGSCATCGTNCPGSFNISMGKPTSQSSNFDPVNSYPAGRAVDGNNSNFQHTGSQSQPWLEIDLGVAHTVSSIEIRHRADCPTCNGRTKKFRVFVTNSQVMAYADNGFVYEYNNGTGLVNGEILNITSLTAQGRYVRIWADNVSPNVLHLAEVRVMGCTNTNTCINNQAPTNVTISSTSSSYPQNSSFVVNASATDADGSINRIEFYNGPTLLGSDNSNPYSYTVNPASAASYALTAKAFDNCGAETSSTVLNITTTVSCVDGFKNGNETGIDCGSGVINCPSCPPMCTTSTLISQGKPTSQSSNFDPVNSYPAGRAVDGNNSNFQHTGSQTQPWLEIDLGAAHTVTSIEIRHRADCPQCNGRTKKFRVFVSNSQVTTYADNGFVYEYNNATGLVNGEILNITSLTAHGRYVRIWADNISPNVLHLAEVRVMGCTSTTTCTNNQAPTNVTISSTSNSYPRNSSFVVNASATDADGSINRIEFYNGPTLLGSDNSNPYSYTVNPASAASYALTAKAVDNCGAETSSTVLNITTTVSCVDGFKNGNETGIDCGSGELNCPSCPPGCTTSTLISQGKPTSQSSNFDAVNSYPAGRAVDGNNSNFQHTGSQNQPWLEIDLGVTHTVTSIEIRHRADCPQCNGRTKKFKVFVSNSQVVNYSDNGFVYEYNNATGLVNGQIINITALTAQGRYVRIWADNVSPNFLHLAEVKVMGCASSAPAAAASINFSLRNMAHLPLVVELYPNPVSDILNFKTNKNLASYRVTILDLFGKQIPLPLLQNNNGLHINHLVPGTYIFKLESNSEVVFKKFIKI